MAARLASSSKPPARSFHRSQRTMPTRPITDIAAPPNAVWWNDWIAASHTRHYMMRDPLNDWIQAYSPPSSDASHPIHDSPYNDFQQYIMKKGCDFEDRVLRLIEQKIGVSNVAHLDLVSTVRQPNSVARTWNLMMQGTPVIHGGVLHHPPSKTYGITDLLVRSDWVSTLIDDPPPMDFASTATRLRDPEYPNKAPSYHYVVIDIKYSSLPFCADGIHLRNSGSFPAYKAQLYLYEQALGFLQGYSSSKAYVLGAGWNIQRGTQKSSSTDPLNRLGTIDYSGWDQPYIEKTQAALEWLRACRSPEARCWNVTTPPLSRPELYPNMCNTHDYPFHGRKVELAESYHELTSLWNVGVQHRQHAHAQHVYSWTDPKCTPSLLGLSPGYKSSILAAILDINQPHTATYQQGRKISPSCIQSRLGNWHERDAIEFFVDFEIINHVLFDFDTEFHQQRKSLVFTIGVGWMEDQQWFYRHFTVNALSTVEEERICREFSWFIADMSRKYHVRKPKCFHWAHAEPSFWKDALARHPQASKHWPKPWQWVDLLKLFQEEPIVVRGALGYSLKMIGRAMHQEGLIQSIWSKHSLCKDGQTAMLCAIRSAKDAAQRKIPLISDVYVQDILSYNEMDVKVLMEVLMYLRQHHLTSNDMIVGHAPEESDSSSWQSKTRSLCIPARTRDRIRPIAGRTRSKTFMLLPIAYRTRSKFDWY